MGEKKKSTQTANDLLDQITVLRLPVVPVEKEFHKLLSKPWAILHMASVAAQSFLTTYSLRRTLVKAISEKSLKGAATDVEQDQLRAAVVFACAGLDSMVKQLTRDCLPWIVQKDGPPAEMTKKKLSRWIRDCIGEEIGAGYEDPLIETGITRFHSRRKPVKLLQALCLSPSVPLKTTVVLCVDYLTGDSLLSVMQLNHVRGFLGLSPIKTDSEQARALEKAFKTRNLIVHEMDVNLQATNRNRYTRKQDLMLDLTSALIQHSIDTLIDMDKLLKSI